MDRNRLKLWAQEVKRDVFALYLAIGDPRVPWLAKAAAAVVACYALSPIDLIPDFIPVLGLLDDLILVPLGLMLVVRLIPKSVMNDLRNNAGARFAEAGNRPRSLVAAIFVVGKWASLALGTAISAGRYIKAT